MAKAPGADGDHVGSGFGLDLRDILTLLGILLLAGGLYLVWLPAALIVPGALFIYLGVVHGAPKQS